MNILQFDHDEAREFFLKEESYFNFDLPPYFVFEELLREISGTIGDTELEEFYKGYKPATGKVKKPFPSDFEDVNYVLLNNKDGKYAWRPFELIHPCLYVALVHKITIESNWELIQNRFKEFQNNEKLICHSIPTESEDDSSDVSTSIINWWQGIEQESLKLALSFEYVIHTDISDCYGSIYTHSIPWAIHTKAFSKKNRGQEHVGNAVDKLLRDMSFGQTNGIPQGSTLTDFIAEMILGYADLELTEQITNQGITDYKILRYRDDYRIFVNNPQEGELITKYLTEILISLGMRLNAQKTLVSNDVIVDSIKPDKLYWLSQKKGTSGLQQHLLLILKLSREHPNSGSLRKALDKFYNRILKLEETDANIHVLVSILIDIAFKNPRTYPISCGILSKLLSLIDDEDESDEILTLINKRFSTIPNTGHIKIWLQRVTIKLDRAKEYEEPLCQLVNDDSVELWNSEWLNLDLQKIMNEAELIDEDVIDEIDEIIETDEILLFDY